MNTIERHVLELIGEDPETPDVFSDISPIRESINDAIEEISIVTGCYKETYHLSLKAYRNFYSLSTKRGSIAWITDVWLQSLKRRMEQTDLIRLNAFNPRWLKNTGSPEAYLPIGFNNIGVWPAPSADGSILEIWSVMIPSRYTEDTDRIKLRDTWEWAAAHYAVGEYYASIGEVKQAIMHHNDYLKKVGVKAQYPYATERLNYYRSEKEPWPKVTE